MSNIHFQQTSGYIKQSQILQTSVLT
jgi:hypothetical protein